MPKFIEKSRGKISTAGGGFRFGGEFVSPVFADLKGFPPLFINVGTDEILLDDSVRLAENAKSDGVEVKIKIWDGMFHMFHYLERLCPEGKDVCREIYREIEG